MKIILKIFSLKVKFFLRKMMMQIIISLMTPFNQIKIHSYLIPIALSALEVEAARYPLRNLLQFCKKVTRRFRLKKESKQNMFSDRVHDRFLIHMTQIIITQKWLHLIQQKNYENLIVIIIIQSQALSSFANKNVSQQSEMIFDLKQIKSTVNYQSISQKKLIQNQLKFKQ